MAKGRGTTEEQFLQEMKGNYNPDESSTDENKNFKIVNVEVIEAYGNFKVGHKAKMFESTAKALKKVVKIVK